jgi:uncharacterized protein YvpB
MAKLIEVPYRNQRNNDLNPDGACNVTCMAMALLFRGVKPKDPDTYPQFEDELYDRMEQEGLDRHQPSDLAKLAGLYGMSDRVSYTASIAEIKAAIDRKRPVIVHGYFTEFGHIIILIGYDEAGFIVHDPYGEWHSWGYDRNDSESYTKGKSQHYSYQLIRDACMDEKGIWAHFLD